MVRNRRRKSCYPAHPAQETEQPFRLLQVDVKDVHDKASLWTKLTTHLSRRSLPRYQCTALRGRMRLRFISYSHQLRIKDGMRFMLSVVEWIGSDLEVRGEIELQTDWGVESRGDNPEAIGRVNKKYFKVREALLGRHQKGRAFSQNR